MKTSPSLSLLFILALSGAGIGCKKDDTATNPLHTSKQYAHYQDIILESVGSMGSDNRFSFASSHARGLISLADSAIYRYIDNPSNNLTYDGDVKGKETTVDFICYDSDNSDVGYVLANPATFQDKFGALDWHQGKSTFSYNSQSVLMVAFSNKRYPDDDAFIPLTQADFDTIRTSEGIISGTNFGNNVSLLLPEDDGLKGSVGFNAADCQGVSVNGECLVLEKKATILAFRDHKGRLGLMKVQLDLPNYRYRLRAEIKMAL
jgi:hypothetical protein